MSTLTTSTPTQNCLIKSADQNLSLYNKLSNEVFYYSGLVYERIQNLTSEQQKQIVELLKKLGEHKETILQKGKNSQIAKHVDEIAESVITHIENQLSQVNYLYNKQKLEFTCAERQTKVKRLQALAIAVNKLVLQIIQDQLLKIKSLKSTQQLIKLYERVLVNPRIREIIIFSQIAREVLPDLGRTYILKPSSEVVNKYILTPIVQKKEQTTVVISDVRTKLFQQYIPLAKEKYSTLKDASIEFYQNKVSIQFAKGYYEKNKSSVEKELKEMYDNFKNYQKTAKQRFETVYKNALDSYQSKRQTKIEKYQQKKQIETVKEL